jgi:hypothetical protein
VRSFLFVLVRYFVHFCRSFPFGGSRTKWTAQRATPLRFYRS